MGGGKDVGFMWRGYNTIWGWYFYHIMRKSQGCEPFKAPVRCSSPAVRPKALSVQVHTVAFVQNPQQMCLFSLSDQAGGFLLDLTD